MKKIIIPCALLALGMHVNAQFPYTNSLQTSSAYNQISGSTGVSLNATVGGIPTKGVLLTPAVNAKFSGIELSGINFATDRGFNIDFEYFQWGGSNRGDGLALVLFDASATTPTMGAKGAGLGFTYSKDNGAINTVQAFSEAYMAFGIDTFGNFHKRRSEISEYRNGGVEVDPGSTAYYRDITTRFTNLRYGGDDNSSYFSIRGGVNKPKWQGNATSDNSTGNPLLYTVNTQFETNGATTGDANVNAIALSPNNDGTHSSRYINTFKKFDIRGGSYTDNTNANGYRKAYIQFRKGVRKYYTGNPDTNPTATINEEITSYFADVYIETNTSRELIAKDEQIRISAKNNPSTVERYYADPTSPSLLQQYNPNLTYLGKAPNNLKMAFTASTGAAYQNQLVRNVNIALPFSPITISDVANNVCPDTPSTIVKPLANDSGYNNDVYIQRVIGTPNTNATSLVFLSPIISTPATANLDSASFAFMRIGTDGKYYKINPNGTIPEDNHTITINNVGTFQYIYKENSIVLTPDNAYIRFTPAAGISGSINQNLFYTVKNINVTSQNGQQLGDEEYRSAVSTITVGIKAGSCGKSHIITNRNVTPVIKK